MTAGVAGCRRAGGLVDAQHLPAERVVVLRVRPARRIAGADPQEPVGTEAGPAARVTTGAVARQPAEQDADGRRAGHRAVHSPLRDADVARGRVVTGVDEAVLRELRIDRQAEQAALG